VKTQGRFSAPIDGRRAAFSSLGPPGLSLTIVLGAAILVGGCGPARTALEENAGKIIQAVGKHLNVDEIVTAIKDLAHDDPEIAVAISTDVDRLLQGSASKSRVDAASQRLHAWLADANQDEDVAHARDLIVRAACSARDQLIRGEDVDVQAVLVDELDHELGLHNRRADAQEAADLIADLAADSSDPTTQKRAVAYAICLAQ
jgi:hypothetical protein